MRISITFYRSLLHSLFTNLICFSSKFWDLPDHCALPWQELFDDEIETKPTGKNLAGNQENSNLWNSFANEKTREEEEEMDALLLEAEDESAMDQFLLQATL